VITREGPPAVEKLLAKARLPAKTAMRRHPLYHGKIQVVPKCCVKSLDCFSIWYTPGVAEPCRAIQKNKELVYEFTNKWNTVAVVTDGTRVLGLGDIGPEAAMPVMEGKALLYKFLGGVDGFPICLDTKDPEKFIETVKLLQPSFGGINLEDISQPKCFDILDRLRAEMEIPVWHDDQQGTATVTVAGLLNALKIVGKDIGDVGIAVIGAGASGICTAKLLIKAGADPGRMVMTDTKGILGRHRPELKATHRQKWEMAELTNAEGRQGGTAEAMRGMDVVIALSTPGPGTISREWVQAMAPDPIVFALANPVPELWPWEAKEAGAAVVATGRSDFPNQVNNSLGFPGIFRGALDVRASTITDEMCLAAAAELAACGEEQGLDPERILPSMEDWEVFVREAVAVGMKAIGQGIARTPFNEQELYRRAARMINESHATVNLLMDHGFIFVPPEAAGDGHGRHC